MGDEFFVPADWSEELVTFFDETFTGIDAAYSDDHLMDLFDKALFDFAATPDERADALEDMRNYVWDEYEWDFDELFDWDAYREFYETA